MEKSKKRIPAWLIELAVALTIILFIWVFAGASAEGVIDDIGGGCFSVVFDKVFVKGADRVVIHEGKQVFTVTDKEAVRQIADTFLVANCTDVCSVDRYGMYMEVYNGNLLVRVVRRNHCSEAWDIYNRDLFHWVFPSDSGIGKVVLTNEELARLEQLLAQYRPTQ